MLLSCKAQVGVIAVQKLLYRIVKHLEQLIILGVIEIKYCIVMYCIVFYGIFKLLLSYLGFFLALTLIRFELVT